MFFYFCFNRNGKITLNKLEHYLNPLYRFIYQALSLKTLIAAITIISILITPFSTNRKGKERQERRSCSSFSCLGKKSVVTCFLLKWHEDCGCAIFASFSSMCFRTEQLYSLAYLVITHQFVQSNGEFNIKKFLSPNRVFLIADAEILNK